LISDIVFCLVYLTHLAQRRNYVPFVQADVGRVQALVTESPVRRRIQQNMLDIFDRFSLTGNSLAAAVGEALNAEVINMMQTAVS
jgi:hypothetical protein